MGRKRCTQEALPNGVLQVLVNGVAWQKIADCGASGSSCFRYFQKIQRRGKLKLVYELLAEETTDIEEGALDTSTVTSFRFRHLTGWDEKHKKCGTKISLFTDKDGLPADVVFAKGNTHDLTLLPRHVKRTSGRRKNLLNLDKVYTSLEWRRKLRNKGIRVNMKMRRRDYRHKRGPKFTFDKEKYRVRFLVERTNGWIKAFRRLRLRREYRQAMLRPLFIWP